MRRGVDLDSLEGYVIPPSIHTESRRTRVRLARRRPEAEAWRCPRPPRCCTDGEKEEKLKTSNYRRPFARKEGDFTLS